MYSVYRSDNVEPIRKFAIEFTNTLGIDCDPDYYLKRWRVFIETKIGVLWYLEHDEEIVGGIGGIVAPDVLSGKDTMVELFWYVTPSHRKRGIVLFNEMAKYVKEHNLRWAMVHMEKSMPDKLKTFYTKEGFKLLETHWVQSFTMFGDLGVLI